MDRAETDRTEYRSSVRADGPVAIRNLLHRPGGDRRERCTDAAYRRTVHADAVLRSAENHRLAAERWIRGQSEADTPAHARNGFGGDLSEATAVGSGGRPPDLSIPAETAGDCPAQSGVGHRYHVHPPASGLCIPGGDYGLVQPVRSVLGAVGDAGRELLRGGVGMGVEEGKPADLQFRSRLAVHERRIHGAFATARDSDQHGRTWAGDGQHFHRETVADAEVRRSVFERLRASVGGISEPSRVFWFLQQRASASIIGLPDASRGLFWNCQDDIKNSHVATRPGRRSSSVDDRGTEFSVEIFPAVERKKKEAKKERKGRPVENDAPGGNPTRQDFHSGLQNPSGFAHFPPARRRAY